jgi:hypothetical protein
VTLSAEGERRLEVANPAVRNLEGEIEDGFSADEIAAVKASGASRRRSARRRRAVVALEDVGGDACGAATPSSSTIAFYR